MPYEIAAYLTDEQKRRMLEAEYGPNFRTKDGYCPLGMANIPGLEYVKAPGFHQVALALEPFQGIRHGTIRVAARTFMEDGDHGQIDDLAEALGVDQP